ncbi:NACHT domain-containing protein [Arthrobacter alpinus]|uniref:NACHT domain-containing protein n=1 Tax=Arthrobacter alpinus TaxID=656366 RepID=UPI001364A222|nr:NACHT domain-containing protein [Arthrobacter alpinus]
MDEAIREQADRLESMGVEFIPWDAERINELLRDQPRLVARFFGEQWVAPFCGQAHASSVPDSQLSQIEFRFLRTELHSLYQAAFVAVASLRPNDGAQLVMLDAVPRPEDTADYWAEVGSSIDAVVQDSSSEDAANSSESPPNVLSATYRSRRSLRSIRLLLSDRRGLPEINGAMPADDWFAGGNRNLLIGAPGAGKSSLLRYIATDLLADEPTSVAMQRSHGDRLPVWLPFGFLCHHLDANDSNSLATAVEAWLTSHARPDLYPLVARALEDDRLLLLIDGIDEWTTESTAGNALAKLETFLGHTEAAVILTSRPYAVARLPFNLIWRKADLAPLDSGQQFLIAQQHLVPGNYTRESESPSVHSWSKSNVQPFIAQISAVPELEAFARTPLLLALLARIWRGEPLPGRRFDLYDLIIRMLVDTHPKMRARASTAATRPLHSKDFLVLIQAVAYRLKVDEVPHPIPAKTMQKFMVDALADEEILGYDKRDAYLIAACAMEMAEDEFGLLVPQGAKHVGFVHRIVGDHLAGRHLAELSTEIQLDAFVEMHGDPAWSDVLLAALNSQPNKHIVAQFVDSIVNRATTSRAEPWPRGIEASHAVWEFIGATLASDVNLAPRKTRELLGFVVDEIESSPFLSYRASLISILVDAAVIPSNWGDLLPIFRRWLDVTRPNPSEAVWAMAELPEELNDRVRKITIQSMRHEDSSVRSAAVKTFAVRYGTVRSTGTEVCSANNRPVDADLVEVIRSGPDARTQTAALMALVDGWPEDEVTWEHVEWARTTSKSNLRTGALFAIANRDQVTPLRELFDARDFGFVMNYLRHERELVDDHDWTAMNSTLVTRAVTESSDEQKGEFAEFALTTLRQRPLGEGNRQMCWQLACGPLNSHNELRDWVIGELNPEDGRTPLVLYNLNLIPDAWLEHEPMVRALTDQADTLLQRSWRGYFELSRRLPAVPVRDALMGALNGFRPIRAARELVERFGQDPKVVQEIENRFEADESASALAPIAIKCLGPKSGFARVYELLRSFNVRNPETADEPHVVVAVAVAQGWYELRQIANQTENNPLIEPGLAASILKEYNEKDVAAACMAVPTRKGLGWHISEIIRTWPSHCIDYTLEVLHRSDHITNGLADPIHSMALRAHANQPSPRSAEVLELAIDLLTPLPPELREVLAHDLCRASITPAQLIQAAHTWMNDPDQGVRRTIAVGTTQAFLSEYQQGDYPSPEFASWKNLVRAQLCAYGPNYEEDRQIAWICMLLLRAPELLDGQFETVGEATPPAVRLTDVFGNPDELLVDLILQEWDLLSRHLGEPPLQRLSSARATTETDESKVLLNLMAAVSVSPAFAEFIEQRIAAEESKDTISSTRQLVSTTPGYVGHLIATQGQTTANYRRVFKASCEGSNGNHFSNRERWAFTHLIDHWDITDADKQAILRQAETTNDGSSDHMHSDGLGEFGDGSVARAAHDVLYPHSNVAQRRLHLLIQWFGQSSSAQPDSEPFTWLEAIVLTFMSTPAEHLPLLIERVFHLRRLEVSREPMWKFTTPLLRRLATDAEAVESLISALNGLPSIESSPLFNDPALVPGQELAAATRRTFLFARFLKEAGKLTSEHLSTAIAGLRTGDPRTVVADPFASCAGPVSTLGAALTDGLTD